MKKNIMLIITTIFLLSFISVAYAAFNSELNITGEGIVQTDTVAPTCGSWYLRDSNLTIQQAYDQNKFINPGSNTTWTNTNKKLFIECSDNMAGDYGCINVTTITDSNNTKRYFKEVKEYTSSIQTDSNVVTVTLQDAYLNSTTCTLPVGGSNPYIDKQGPTITITPTGVDAFEYSATDDIGVKGYMVTTSNVQPALDSENWIINPEEITIDKTGTKTYYVWAKDDINITNQNIKTYSLSKTVGAGTTLSLKENNSSGNEVNSNYVLENTKIYVDASMDTGYHDLVIKKNNANINNQTIHTINANTTISSLATVNTYLVHYNANGGTGTMSDQLITYNNTTQLTKNTYTKTGYSFIGWNTLANGTGISYDDEQSVSNLTDVNNDTFDLYAQWIYDAQATITLVDFNTFSYSSNSGAAYYVSTSSTIPDAGSSAASSSFALNTWTTATNTGNLTLANGVTYYVFVKDSTTGGLVSSNYSSISVRTVMRSVGTGSALITKLGSSTGTEFNDNIKYVLNGTSIYATAVASTGYSNATVTVSAGTLSSNIVVINNDTVISSSATPNVYSITLNNQGASTTGTTVIYEKYNTGYYLDNATTNQMTSQNYAISKPSKSGLLFAGYYEEVNCGGSQYISDTGFLTSTASTTKFSAAGTLYACYIQVRAVDLCYDNSLTNVNCQEVQCMIDYLASLKYGATLYTLTFNNNTGSGCTSKTGIFNSQWGELCTPTKTGYNFAGWNTEQNGSGTTITSSSFVTDDLTVYAQWSPKTYTVSFDSNNGSGGQSSDVTATYDAAMPTISTTAPTRTGHTFQGWYDNTNYTASGAKQYYTAAGASAATYDKTSDTTLYAGWSPNTYTITYDNNTGSGCTTGTGTYGQAWGTLCTPTKTGYSLDKWNTAIDGSGTTITSSTLVTGDVSVFAIWKANTYTVAFSANGGSGGQSASVTATYDSAMPAITTTKPTRTGYTFQGWYDNSNYAASGAKQYYTAAGASARSYDKASGTTLYAGWKANSYTLTANANGGSISSTSGWSGTGNTATKSVNYGSAYSTLPNVSRSGNYRFLGWFTASSGGSQVSTSTTMGASNTTIYAHWQATDGTSKSFGYTGAVQTYIAPSAGTYKLEVCGAQGGSPSGYGVTRAGGQGGCASGNVSLTAGQTLYVFVGGQGSYTTGTTTAAGGWNGGTAVTGGNSACYFGTGGGATHISKTNATIANAGSNLLIVGGGGGSGNFYYASDGSTTTLWFNGVGGNGGGASGGSGTCTDGRNGNCYGSAGTGGTQSAGGSTGGTKGVGAVGGGGGGYYGGGGARGNNSIGSTNYGAGGGGGGSGYVGGVSSASWTSSSCSTGSNLRTGNGCAKITKQ